MQKKNNFIKNIISTIFIIILIVVGTKIYQKNNFNDYIKAEYKLGLSNFERDSQEKCSEYNSYKIENKNYNDAMFYKTIDVIPNTPYKVTCKIKTKDVKTLKEETDAGAHICIKDGLEKSDNVTGTTDWTQVEFYFNSKNKSKIDLGFRLGGYEDNCIGTAWFSDFTIESGLAENSNEWKVLCVLFDNVDTNIDGKNINLQLTSIDKDDIATCMRRFKSSMQEMSKGKIKIEYDIIETKEPIQNFTYDEENGYYVSGYNVRYVLDTYIKQGKYDHIFIAFRTGDLNQKGAIQINDWIGLGSMEYRGIGLSNIRLPDDDHTYVYKYDTRINTFPEEVFVHEFLHTLERNALEYHHERPELHDNEKYGYENKRLIGLKEWYEDYMNKNINTESGKIGLPEEIFEEKPVKTTNFSYSHKLNSFQEPQNIIEEINIIINRFKRIFENKENIKV